MTPPKLVYRRLFDPQKIVQSRMATGGGVADRPVTGTYIYSERLILAVG